MKKYTRVCDIICFFGILRSAYEAIGDDYAEQLVEIRIESFLEFFSSRYEVHMDFDHNMMLLYRYVWRKGDRQLKFDV